MMNAKPVEKNFTDIDLSLTEKKPFRFGNDDNRVVYLNTADMNLIKRAEELLPKIGEIATKFGEDVAEAQESKGKIDEDTIVNTYKDKLTELDLEMRNLIDELFNAPVSAAAAPDGSMFDIFNGTFRYEIIIDVVGQQFLDNIQSEIKKMESKLKQHTKKYTKGKK